MGKPHCTGTRFDQFKSAGAIIVKRLRSSSSTCASSGVAYRITSSKRRKSAVSSEAPWFVAATMMLSGCPARSAARTCSACGASLQRHAAPAACPASRTRQKVHTAGDLESFEDQAKLRGAFPMNLVMRLSNRAVKSGSFSSVASTAAVIVLPVPGGPTNKSLRRAVNPCSLRRSC